MYLLPVFIVLYAGDKDEEHGVEGLFALDIWKQSFSVKHVLLLYYEKIRIKFFLFQRIWKDATPASSPFHRLLG